MVALVVEEMGGGAEMAVLLADHHVAPAQGLDGVAGMPAILDLRGDDDLFGRPLKVSIVGIADELAAAASVLQGQAAEGSPAVIIRGYSVAGEHTTGQALIRDKSEDLFR